MKCAEIKPEYRHASFYPRSAQKRESRSEIANNFLEVAWGYGKLSEL